jgi:signal transduction histidine kinase
MKSLFNSLIDETRQHFPGNQFSVVLNPLTEAYGDLALLKLMITNLLSNAVKFSSKQEKAEIIIGSAPGEHESVFYVRDNGIGFDMKYAPELFDVFHRLHNTGDYEGTGIGLALVKRIIERHGGRIWVESEPHKGAAFYFAIPGKTGS